MDDRSHLDHMSRWQEKVKVKMKVKVSEVDDLSHLDHMSRWQDPSENLFPITARPLPLHFNRLSVQLRLREIQE